MSTQSEIERAIVAKSSIHVIYHGGSNPGAYREIAPIEIIKDKVRAKCKESNAVKLFSINKIEIPGVSSGNSGIGSSGFNDLSKKKYTDIDTFFGEVESALMSLGWHVHLEGKTISLHRSFKNGKPMKTPDVSLGYEEFTREMYFDGSPSVDSVKIKSKPWSLKCKNEFSSDFAHLDRAIDKFMHFANIHAPSNRP